MITLNDAITEVRKSIQNVVIINGFEYDGDYVFRIGSSDEHKGSGGNGLISVRIDDGVVHPFDIGKSFLDIENFSKAEEKGLLIDIKAD